MGVPRLFQWLIKSFPESVIHFRDGEYVLEVDNLYLDANGILHTAAQFIFNYGPNKRNLDRYSSLHDGEKRQKVYEEFFEIVTKLTKIVVPKKLLYIAIDGPAPLAKQAQQRQRRFVASLGKKEGGEAFTSNELTPGTLFMLNLTKYVHFAIRKEMNTNPAWKNIEVIFSPPTVQGEGEHKCISHIRSNIYAKNQSHCIFGPDGDLIMLTLAAHVSEIFLFREDQYNADHFHLLDMGYVRHHLPQVLGVPHIDPDTAIDDFILLGFFVGNDFLPKIQMFMYLEEGLELMIYNYAQLASTQQGPYLTSNGHINHRFFAIFVNELAKREYEYIISQHFIPSPDPRFVNKTLQACVTEKNGQYFLDMTKYRELYYRKSGINIHKDQQKLGRMCVDYIKTLYWIFQYYISGLPSWEYYYPWHYPPLMVDLIHALKHANVKEFSTFELGKPSVPFVQLLSVLPPSNSHLLPEKLRFLFKDKKLENYYPTTFKIDYEGKTKEHMGVTLLPFVDVSVIRTEYEKVKLPRYARNTFTKSELFYYNPDRTSIHHSSNGIIKNNHVFKMFI